ncbi:MAG: TIGR03960 family B12-binding radical SAM protein [Oscillospiraceae bacterium]|nr:TIGR03960 family B12-binding radical SAM protein [Oscillospiraceae bacterium]
MDIKLERILRDVQKPARYTGGEFRQIIKDQAEVSTTVAYCFPDTYEIGMSNLGLRIMYGVLNSIDGCSCERVFSPWIDMEEQMRISGLQLYALESGKPVREFDIVAFSLGYELSYTNVLNMLDLAAIPLKSSDRGDEFPLVIAGGTCCFNPEPLADFIDLFVIGEGENAAVELVELYRENRSRDEFLLCASKIEGIYVPSLYDVSYNPDGTVSGISGQNEAALPVKKRIIKDLDSSYFPVDSIVPSTGLVHDRVVLELFRGCVRGCRFCQAGHITRPVRNRSVDTLVSQGVESLKNSGYDELALLSLSTSDYPEIFQLCDSLMQYCEPRRTNLSLPSLRADNFSVELMESVQKVRKAGLTFAPEAGSQRMRDVINKNLTQEQLLETCRVAFEGGWNSVKLYFMLGLPSETDEDVVAIAELSRAVLYTWKQHARNKSRGVRITVSTSCFIPKPHTPFQWEPQIPMDEYLRRVDLLKESMRSKAINYNWHSPEQGYIEAALARGDRRLGAVIEAAWRNGARLDSWSECFSLSRWLEAFETSGLEAGFYAMRERDISEILPWSTVSCGISKEHFLREREAAKKAAISPDCLEGCAGCGMQECVKGGAKDEAKTKI